MLSYTDPSVADIATQLCYASSKFTLAFQTATGQSSARYRVQHGYEVDIPVIRYP